MTFYLPTRRARDDKAREWIGYFPAGALWRLTWPLHSSRCPRDSSLVGSDLVWWGPRGPRPHPCTGSDPPIVLVARDRTFRPDSSSVSRGPVQIRLRRAGTNAYVEFGQQLFVGVCRRIFLNSVSILYLMSNIYHKSRVVTDQRTSHTGEWGRHPK